MRMTSRSEAVEVASAFMDLVECHPLNATVMRGALSLMLETGLRGRDAIHAATALGLGFDQIVTADRDFASVPKLMMIPPDEAVTVLLEGEGR
jgi:predicted nucleic acid-binding protein